MQLPKEGSHWSKRNTLVRYTVRRLRRARRTDLAEPLEKARLTVKKKGRAWEDEDEAIQDAIADRDGCSDALTAAVQQLRLDLASRALNANKKPPYTLVFPNGIEYYTDASLEDVKQRYGELSERLKEHLPADDAAAVKALPALAQGLHDFGDARTQHEAACTSKALAATALETAEHDVDALLERTFGALVSEYNRKYANTFFPRGVRRKTVKK